jgi:hypothetical protein
MLVLNTFLISPMRAACLVHLALLDLVILIIITVVQSNNNNNNNSINKLPSLWEQSVARSERVSQCALSEGDRTPRDAVTCVCSNGVMMITRENRKTRQNLATMPHRLTQMHAVLNPDLRVQKPACGVHA